MDISAIFTFVNVFLLYLGKLSFAGRNFYEILNVPRTATLNEIKKAYRALAKEWHPDKHQNDKIAHEKFQDISAAYEVLSNNEKRELYNQGGEELVKQRAGGESGGHHSEFFHSFFGDFFGSSQRNDETPRGADVVVDLWVTLEELYNGEFVEVQRAKTVFKQTSGTRKCNCRQEMQTVSMGPGRFQMFQQQVCDDCPNVKRVTEERMLEVEVEQGMDDGQEQTFFGDGEPHVDGEPGDLKFRIRLRKHPVFERRGTDLYTNVTISLEDALNGFSTTLKHLDGRPVKISRDKITKPGARMRRANEGMPFRDDVNKRGTLYITFDVQFPNDVTFTDEQKTLISKLFQSSDFKPNFYNGLQGY